MRKAVIAFVVLALAAALAWWRPWGPSYAPVAGNTALDTWRAPWNAAPASAEGRLPKRWIVVGWDGAGWDLLLPLVDAGKMPALSSLMREGGYGAMRSFKPTFSPVLWTTVATGVDPAHHGILAWGRVENGETRRLFTNADRRARALWNLMTDAGRPSLVVGYHNTFPADRIDGLMVSNFLYHEHLEDRMAIHDDATKTGAGLVYPTSRLPEILAIQREVTQAMPPALRRFAAYGPADAAEFQAPLARALRAGEDERKFFLKKAWLFDTMTGRIAEAEYPAIRPELAMVHFQCIDFASHYFLYFKDPSRFASMKWSKDERASLEAQQPLYAGTVEAFARYADEWLDKLLALRDADTGVLLLSDHGFEPEDNPKRTGDHPDAPPGIFVIAGPGVKTGKLPDATLYDVMPTLAAALGLPVAKDLRSSPRADWFTAPLHAKEVAHYGSGQGYVPDIPLPDETEKELLDQLRAIGYVR
ncbi:MAG TPA: alkaline phosphatase family protein [Candidatus Polarisedimenticolaceae bacterium]|nr:alkaline phosphatase family protein [Candidatus Polarisedimenticolaceae bacterium]